MPNEFPDLSIQQLLAHNRYSVPRYQRNYAWTEEHIKQLIDDVLDSASDKNGTERSYYLGTLVVFPRKQGAGLIYEVIDGQQRLTTLTLLASYLTYKERDNQNGADHWYTAINLDFESRKRSSETLFAAHNGNFHDSAHKKSLPANYTEEIVDAYEIIQRLLPERCREKAVSEAQFSQYFLNQVRICRVDVPEDTDLNHYFEIMNNRGEQLEKHEVLKARLMNKLSPGDDQLVFNRIWEACSAMDKYIQYGFEKNLREKLFGTSWDHLMPVSTEELYHLMTVNASTPDTSSNGNHGLSIDQLIAKSNRTTKSNHKEKTEEEEPERFSSIINFQNFLPHVLSVFLNDGTITLDDKQLLDSFSRLESRPPEKIKEFSYALLKMRFLFDQNIIKRDATENEREWSLKKLHLTDQGNPSYRHTFSLEQDTQEGIQRQITLLQSMFHVSIPSRPYKYWLQGVLKYLYEADNIQGKAFKKHLRRLAKAFVYNRFLASSPLDYNGIIFTHEGKAIQSDLDFAKTRYGQVENILVFNFIDYLLWEKMKDEDEKIKNFVFTFRSSVEHYYPQNPIDGNPLSEKEILHSVGNLCLISHSKNSMLRHHLPKAKAEYYLKQSYIDSILQYQMLSKAEDWSAEPVKSIQAQEQKVFELLEKHRP